MATGEKDKIFASKIKYDGLFDFNKFYKFCYDWLSEETELDVSEEGYSEKLAGEAKELKVKWTGTRKVTDYFKFEIKIEMKTFRMKSVEVNQNGAKKKTNSGIVEMDVKGYLIKDYQGKFETNGFLKFLRTIYEKWVIPARVDQYETKLFGDCDEFLGQAKAWLDLEGKTRH